MKSWSASVEPTTSSSSRPKRACQAWKSAAGSVSPEETQSRSEEQSKRRSAFSTWSSRR